MGTRSDIIVHLASDKWARIYCHWDGYLEHNGRILFDHYTSQQQAEALVALGNLSSLGPEIGRKHPFDKPRGGKVVNGEWVESPAVKAYEKKYGKMCVAYSRDRPPGMWCQEVAKTKAELIRHEAATIGDTIQAVWPETDTWTEFTYVWDEGKWWVTSPDEGTQTLIDLGDALLGKRTIKPAVKAFGMIIGQHNKTEPGKDHSWSGFKD